MRTWMAMILGLVACTACTGSDGQTGDSGTTPSTVPSPKPTMSKMGKATLDREGEYELRGESWTGTERLRLFEDDLFEPVEVCIITYTVTGTEPVETCTECNASPDGNGGAHAFVISGPSIETELYDGACDIVLSAPTVDVSSLDDLDGATLVYGWGEEPTNHGYAIYQMDAMGAWFFRETMGYPWENTDGVLDQREVDAYMRFTLSEGTYAF